MNAIWILWLKPFRNGKQKSKNIHFQNCKKIKNEKVNFLDMVSTKNIFTSRKARNFFKKGKLIFIKKSLR